MEFYISVTEDHSLCEPLLTEIDVCTTFQKLGSCVLVQVDGSGLTSYKCNVFHSEVYLRHSDKSNNTPIGFWYNSAYDIFL